MPTQIQIKRGSTTPAGLTLGEQAINTNTNQIYIGGTGGTTWIGGEVTGGVDMGAGSAVSAVRVPTQSAVYNYARNNFVTSFNGLTGAVGGVTTSVANTFTAAQTFNSGVTASTLDVSGAARLASTLAVTGVLTQTGGATFASTTDHTGVARFAAGVTMSGRLDVGGNFKVLGDTQLGDTNTDLLTVFAGTTFNNRTDFAGSNNFANGLTSSGQINQTGNILFRGSSPKTITSNTATLTIVGATSGSSVNQNTISFGVQTTDSLTLNSTTSFVNISTTSAGANPSLPGLRIVTNDADVIGQNTVAIQPITYLTGTRTQYLQDASGTLALTSQLMGAINGSTAATTAVTSFNGLTGAVGGVTTSVANTFTALQTFNSGISAAGGITLASPNLIGTPTSTTAVTGTNTTQIATTAFVQNEIVADAVTAFNGRTGSVQGVSAAIAGTGISVSGATGSVTITNIGVQSFNGLTGAVGGVTTSVANTFTALQTFTSGISASGGVTFNGTVNGITATFTKTLTGYDVVAQNTLQTPVLNAPSASPLNINGSLGYGVYIADNAAISLDAQSEIFIGDVGNSNSYIYYTPLTATMDLGQGFNSIAITNAGSISALGAITTTGAMSATSLSTFSGGITSSFLYVSRGTTLNSTLQVNGGATFASTTDHTGVARFAGGVTFSGQVNATTFKVNTVGGDEGGQVDFGIPTTNTSLTGGVAIDVYQNRLRFFETGGSARGAYIDLSAAAAGAGTDLVGVTTVNGNTGGVGTVMAPFGMTSAAVRVFTYPDGVTTSTTKTPLYQPHQTYQVLNYSAAVTANRTYFTPHVASRSINLKTLQFTGANTGITGNCYFSVWSADPLTGFPNTRLYASASVAVASGYGTTSVTNAGGLVTVPAGPFFIAVSFSSTPTVYCMSMAYQLPLFGSGNMTSGYAMSIPAQDTSGFTAPTSRTQSGTTFGFIDYTGGGTYRGGVFTEYGIV